MANSDTSDVVLDPVILADLRLLRTERTANLFQELLVVLQSEAPKLLAAMRAAAVEGSAVKLRASAHSLKGAAFSVGATHLGELAAELEALGRAGTVAGAEPILARIEPQFQRVYDALLAEHQRRA